MTRDEYLRSVYATALYQASGTEERDFVDYLWEAVQGRLYAGRSFDCDEYRALCDLAR